MTAMEDMEATVIMMAMVVMEVMEITVAMGAMGAMEVWLNKNNVKYTA